MIRAATFTDIDTLLTLGESMHQESHHAHLPFNRAKVAELMASLIVRQGGVFVYEKDGQIIGGMFGMVVPQWFSGALVAHDFALFLLPEHRGGMAAPRLIKHFIRWAKSMGVSDIELGVNTGVHPEATGSLFERLGFSKKGILYGMRA